MDCSLPLDCSLPRPLGVAAHWAFPWPRAAAAPRRPRRSSAPIRALLLAVLAAPAAFAPARGAPPSGWAAVAELPLSAIDGTTQVLGRDGAPRLRVLCFLGAECPLARLYGPRLDGLAKEFADRGVRFYGINSNLHDSRDDLARYGAEQHIEFPLLKDDEGRAARALGASRTPEVFVIDALGQVGYQGRVDDQYQPGAARPAPTRAYLREALEALLAGGLPAEPRTEAVGCRLALREEPPHDRAAAAEGPTFAGQVSRILNRHCVECHRAGEIGPFPLDDYGEVVGWADTLLEVIDQGRMPPWHASHEHGAFANARRMPPEDVAVLRAWVAAGTPLGDAADLPPPPPRAGPWDLPRPPDAVYPMSAEPFRIPAEGTVEYQYFVVDPQLAEDRWAEAVQIVPGNRAVVHHAIAFLRPPDGAPIRSFGLLGAYVPGQRSLRLPVGHAQRVPAGSRIVFQMHYTPNGRAEEDVTRAAVVFADPDKVTHEVFTIGGVEQEFEIPPRTADYQVEGELRGIPRDGTLLAASPHMHLRGTAFRLLARRAGGEEILLDVPRYDFNWQHNYAFQEPLPLADVEALRFVATFDNSAGNPANPDPAEYVTWGDQTWEEMAVAFATVARPLAPSTAASAAPEGPPPSAADDASKVDRGAAYAERYIRLLDRDGDGRVERLEAPDAVRMFAFRQLDADGDGFLTYDEIARHSSSGRASRRDRR